MDLKKFNYLYFKVRDAAKETILKEAELTEAEFAALETELAAEVQKIKSERNKNQEIGAEFIRLTRYLYEPDPPAAKGVPCPKAVHPIQGEIIPLPSATELQMPDLLLWKAIEQRRSLRKYADEELSRQELSFLLWATQWVKEFRSNGRSEATFRNVPSAGARHPLETYLLLNRIEGLAQGLYYYHPVKHGLVLVEEGERIAEAVFHGSLDQEMVLKSAVTFIWVAIPLRTTWRYSQRGYRYLYLDAGHAGQNLHLAAEAIGCGACMIGAFYDEGMNEILNLDGKNAFVIYMASVGKKPVSA
ncbi:MAG: SagB/ThcOx family dehydrogenase [Candidatus Cloacimonadaceae bacterium]